MIKRIILISILAVATCNTQLRIDWLLRENRPGLSDDIYEIPTNITSLTSNGGTENNNTQGGVYTFDPSNQQGQNQERVQTNTSEEHGETEAFSPEDNKPETDAHTNKKIELSDQDVEKFRRNLRVLAANIYSEISKKTDPTSNILFSPMSISHAIGMINTGARGNSSKQMKNSLQLPEDTQNEYIDALFKVITEEKFTGDLESSVIAMMAARTFMQQSMEVKQYFIQSLLKYYHADVEDVNFSYPKNATERINQWVEDETKGLIKDLIPRGVITQLTRLVLVNALYFKAPWAHGFREDPPNTFMTPTGEVLVPFLQSIIYCKVSITDSYSAVAIPYKDEETYFFLIMPESNKEMKNIERTENLQTHLNELQNIIKQKSKKLLLYIPKFTTEHTVNVKQVLKSMGVVDIFGTNANLKGISDENLFVSDFIHKAKLSLHKGGTEAAAASAVVIAARMLPETLEVNRPFIYGVIESEGDILFMGKMVNPSGK